MGKETYLESITKTIEEHNENFLQKMWDML
jgi:hypothetical protein